MMDGGVDTTTVLFGAAYAAAVGLAFGGVIGVHGVAEGVSI